MFGDLSTMELVKMLLPLIVFQLGLALFCVIQIWTKGVRNLSPIVWTGIVVFINMVGPIAYLLVGRKRWNDDQH